MTPTPPSAAPRAPAPSAPTAARPRLDTRSLMRGGSLLLIEHAGMEYTLRITRTGKLILTK